MASHSHKPNQNEEYNNGNGIVGEILRIITKAIRNIHLCVNQFCQEFYKSLDLDRSICDSISFDLNKTSCDIPYDKIETGIPIQAAKNIGMEMEALKDDEKPPTLDLSLSLSTSGVNFKDNNEDSSTQSEISSISAQRSCMSLDINTINEDLESCNFNQTEDDLPSLILMGCTHCHIYVMVSEVEPKCANCMSSVLIDMFRESPAEKSRRN